MTQEPTAQDSLIPPEARAMIGMESEPVTGYPVAEHEIKRFCYAINDLNPLFVDKEVAQKGPHGGIIAPPFFFNIVFDSWQAPLTEHRTDGLPLRGGSGLPMPPLKVERRMFGGVEVEFLGPVRPGDVLTRKSRLADIYEREGRTGRMVFTIEETSYTNQKGEMVAIERTINIAR